ncbi:MAG: DEAD/DEAH box helicase [Phycisphaerales bacterium]|nr:DEAD/DEAH box helicase [Phycisphaerales bacterium]
MTNFASLNLSARLLETLAAQGYHTPTPIQAQAIPPILAGRDLLGCAQTGTGKTAAFSLPLIERLTAGARHTAKGAKRRARALILAPTRELAAQIEKALQTYGQRTGLRHAIIYGGVNQNRQVNQLRSGVDIIVATPGRLLDLMEQGHVDLRAVETFVLDEADRMLDMGFIHPIRQIARQLPEIRQTLLFSATMPPKIRELADAMLRDPVSVSVTPVSTTAPLIEQTLYHVPHEHKIDLLTRLLRCETTVRTLVFTKTKHAADKLAKRLAFDGVSAGSIHGNKSQSQRQRALDAFRSGRSRVLVATDVAARGLDVDGITHVFNFNLPMEPEAYVHRIGRTGRAGATGQAISFCSRDERALLLAIERLTGAQIATVLIPDEFGLPNETPVAANRPATGAQRVSRKPRSAQGAFAGKRPAAKNANNQHNNRFRRNDSDSEQTATRDSRGKNARRRLNGRGRAPARSR